MDKLQSTPLELAIIGGTSIYALADLQDVESIEPETPFGVPSGPVRIGNLHGRRVAFLARHGEQHSLPPHRVNYRANLWALKSIGAPRVLAINTVGGITERCAPQSLVIPDQIIDYTHGRAASYWDAAGEMLHAEFAEPYAGTLRGQLIEASQRADIELVIGGCYGATQGPRFETRAEVERLRRDGCDVVGMTGMPEAALARELALDYACLAPVANWAAGCGGTGEITLDQVFENLRAASAKLPALLAMLLS